MFRFDQLIRRDMIVRDVKQRHPQTVPVFKRFGFHSVCDDCEILVGARRSGVEIAELLDALNQAAFGKGTSSEKAAETGEHATNS
jgi:hypothetical protein